MKIRRSSTVYVLLAIIWCLVCLWEFIEHQRVVDSAQLALLNRARDISNSIGVVIRSQHFFVFQPRLEAALEELAASEELVSVALLNADGEVVASGGKIIDTVLTDLSSEGLQWGDDTVSIMNLVDLGASDDVESATRPPRIVIPPRTTDDATAELNARAETEADQDGPKARAERKRDRFERDEPRRDQAPPPPPEGDEGREPSRIRRERDDTDNRDRRDRRSRRFDRPRWMSKEKYNELLKKQGLHGFVLVMSTTTYQEISGRDLFLRLSIAFIALLAVISIGFAWRNIERSSALQFRLVRAQEMNRHLREINVAAAGLAHETRNPLNIVRGMAQMLAKQDDASEETLRRSDEIIREVDLITMRLNEFIDYSRPLEAKTGPVKLNAVFADVGRALESDIEDKHIQLSTTGPEVTIEADEPLLRQVMFNLLLNSIQAVSDGGQVELLAEKTGPHQAAFEIRDNGQGVPMEHRDDVFRPYYTTSEGGTGLGLTVVRQIVLAHRWEIEYLPGEPTGARFRVTGVRISK